ncbi:MAG: oligosaccharide flippase family protein [Marinobacter sp.]|uniref:lipopolysaccharide biosynthesis protein n=1 Tax=Marinobacter sp. TaxID=50741 RepID=UPI001B6D6599|nr:oligosaccharide flippase family protein [Marinobacter sp.]MBQ0746655.1 oligosaccharide flippase family protein [Marinobacter sp.]MBQ0814218.1 oligosaccharide flippase family protein [Marinobacter sp.]
MSLKRNIAANYVSQLYVTGIGILILPMYIRYMGAEAYGLVGFFTMLQAWFGVLDMGLTPTIGRETARYHGGSMSGLAYRQLLRALTLIFAGIAVIGGGALWLFAGVIANKWLNIESLSGADVNLAVEIMAISVALRWMGGLYRGVLTGSERMVWLSGFNVVFATLRFVAVFGTMWLYGFTPVVFFLHQLAVAVLEIAGLWIISLKLTPGRDSFDRPIGWSFTPVKPVLKFALSVAFTSSVWVLVTQTDKLVLSGILPLAEYGYFTLAVLVASGIMVISGPVSIAIMPRMARLNAEGKREEMIQVYRHGSQLVSIIAGSAALVIAFNAELLLYAWTGDRSLAEKVEPILRLYVIGNGFLAVAAFPYYLQYALGNLRYHLIGNSVMVVVLIPSIIFAATYFGGIGAGYVWLGVNGLFLFTWCGFVHGRLVPGLHGKWIINDILRINLPVALFLFVVFYVSFNIESRIYALLYLFGLGLAALLIGVIASPAGLNLFIRKYKFNG